MNTNPAGLARLRGLGAELHATAARLQTEHDDGFGRPATIDNDHAFVGDIGLTRRLRAYPTSITTIASCRPVRA